MKDEIKEILDYFQKDVDKYEESKKYLMQKYGYNEETIDNISQHERHINTKKLLNYITNLQEEIKSANESVTWWTNRYEAVVRNCDETVKKMMALGEENERLNNKIKRIAYQCYESDMSYEEFKQIWVNAMGKIYEPSQIDELEKELKENK